MSNPSNQLPPEKWPDLKPDDEGFVHCDAECGNCVQDIEVTVFDDSELGVIAVCQTCAKDTNRICDSCGDWSTETKHIVARDTHYEYGTGVDEGPDLCPSCQGD
jgi:hypothetical protein